ncbi:MAG: response regulator [Armatimonadota bacterium]|nr:MAG: response regulator [Armatimonadota bacterium]
MGDLSRARILVVDDDAAVRSLLGRLLSDAGCRVECAPEAGAALQACRRGSFDLAMIDLRLPGPGGGELAASIADKWPNTAVIIATGVDDTVTAVRCMRGGAFDYLIKPFDLDDVVLRVERALERRRLLLESQRQRAELEGRVRSETRTARRVFLGAIKSLCWALEAKDDYTRGHSERVTRIAGEVARALGVPREDIRRIRLAGRLHDIGKIGVRESVLSKPGPLTEDEYRQVQTHPVIGEQILAPVLLDASTVRIVRHHHEHYGGAGYPDGLRTSAIPFGARVLAVADAFDALTSDRPYRSRLSRERALEVLRGGAGTQWQPTLVEALAQHLEAFWPIVSALHGRGRGHGGEPPSKRGHDEKPDQLHGRR